MKNRLLIATAALSTVFAFSCGGSDSDTVTETPDKEAGTEAGGTGTEGDEAPKEDASGHSHNEVDIGTFKVGEYELSAAQGHGVLAAGNVSHLAVKLPYNDGGATVVRAWVGTSDRTASFVGKGEYAKAHDDYDIHATAPNPLPAGVQWWVEIIPPKGEKLVGSINPLMAK
ncbi:MAG: hypothetical protein ACI841_000305 [Planctomycetota bacterium]|jgi:hypothetical protein